MQQIRSILFLLSLLIRGISLQGQVLDIRWTQIIPVVSAFSSPRVIDLNDDQVLDIVIGAGIEGEPAPAGIFAVDGGNGSVLWQRYARDQMYGSPIFQDITEDGIPEVFITGRDAQFYALDGTTGFAVWEFWPDTKGSALDSGWYNFYLPQWIPDQDQDGYRDIIVTNGGDPRLSPAQFDRPPGYLMALSGKDGSILQLDTMPDGRETYHSPLLADLEQNGELQILLGSGGETVGGSYWQISLDEFMATGLQHAEAHLFNSTEGYIAVPALVDLNQNGTLDMIVPQLDQNIIALEGSTGEELWRYTSPGTDCYVSPAIGQFTGDPTPDVFVVAAEGNWPFFQQSFKLLIDGSNGQVVWSEAGYAFQMTSGVAIDWDDDGFDEIIYPNNQDTASQGTYLMHQLYLYDFNDQQILALDTPRIGAMVFSVPLITDLENDSSLEMIFATSDNTEDWYAADGFTIYCANLSLYREEIAWGGYLGTSGNGHYPMNLFVSISDPFKSPVLQVFPNPVQQILYFHSVSQQQISQIELYDLRGRKQIEIRGSHELNLQDLPPGVYIYRVWVGKKLVDGRIVKL